MKLKIYKVVGLSMAAILFHGRSQEAHALLAQELQEGHVLVAVEGTVNRVDTFYDKYVAEYEKVGSKLGTVCGPANKIYQEAYYYVVFVCNPDAALLPLVDAIFVQAVPSVDSNTELLSLTLTNTLATGGNPISCTGKHCKVTQDYGVTCTYYQCPIDPWCYHTGTTTACVGTHKCP